MQRQLSNVHENLPMRHHASIEGRLTYQVRRKVRKNPLFTKLRIYRYVIRIIHYLSTTGLFDNMATGYVLVNVTPGMEIDAYNTMKGLTYVEDITVLFGDYDLIVKLVADDLATIAKTVVETIRPVEGVINTKTLAGADV